MTAWPDLLATALIGTDRRGGATDEAARSLLDEAAAWTAYRRAGRVAVTGLSSPTPAPAQARPVVPAATAARLAGLADPERAGSWDAATRTALLAELLSLVDGRDRRVPGELLPDLFEAARRHRDLRPRVMAAAGARATWLAAQSPEWTFMLDGPVDADPGAWAEGTPGQRAGHLAATRRTDPAGARARLAGQWPTLAPDERIRLLPLLATGLGPDDEEFLERALDDRRKEVRVAAAELLGSLPGSAYRARAAGRARDCVSVQGGRIVVTPPAECDPAMRRDGVEPRPPARTGERAWWLRQVLARAPLPERVAPPALLSTVEEWADELYRGLAVAAADQDDPGWAAALLDVLVPRLRPNDPDWPVAEALCAALDPAELVRRTVALLGDPKAGPGRLLTRMLEACPAPWSPELAAAALAGFEVHARRAQAPYDLSAATRVAALRLPPQLVDAVAAAAQRWRAERPDSRVDVFAQLARILRQRYEMIQELV